MLYHLQQNKVLNKTFSLDFDMNLRVYSDYRFSFPVSAQLLGCAVLQSEFFITVFHKANIPLKMGNNS